MVDRRHPEHIGKALGEGPLCVVSADYAAVENADEFFFAQGFKVAHGTKVDIGRVVPRVG